MARDNLIQYRRDLHRIPELDADLPKTRAYIVAVLSKLPCTVTRVGSASLCAYFDAGRPSTLAFRSDMDALPIAERNDFAHISTHPGRMHACGHDGHMAILLAFAESLSERIAALRHNVLLIFQAAEETTGGAKEICESGVFARYGVTKIFGLHLWPGCPKGAISCRRNEFMAATRNILVDIAGRSSHAAEAEKGVDALLVGARFLASAYEAVRSELPADVFRLLKFGVFESGTAMNVLSGRTHLGGTMRCFRDADFAFMSRRLAEIAAALDAECGSATEIRYLEGYPPVVNPSELFDEARAVFSANDRFTFIEPDAPSMTAEDFAFYRSAAPALFFHLGIGPGEPLHSARFDFDEDVLRLGAEAFGLLLGGIA